MKKLLAILLAMMLVLVSVAALADGENGSGTNSGGSQGSENGTSSGTSSTPAATTAATAQDPSVNTGYDPNNPTTAAGFPNATIATQNIEIKKHFNISGTGAKVPPQEVSFTVGTGVITVNSDDSLTAPEVTIDPITFTEGNAAADLTKTTKIHLKPYPAVGVYTYPVTETNTDIAGQSYATNLVLTITVIQGPQDPSSTNPDGLLIAGISLKQGAVKTDTLENDYRAHDLTVEKQVSGLLGDQNMFFPITVVLTAPDDDSVYGSVGVTINGTGATVKDGSTNITTTIAAEKNGWKTKTLKLSLKHGQTVTFDNLPEGVKYTVVEDNKTDDSVNGIDHIEATTAAPYGTAAQQADTHAYIVSGQVDTATALTADGTKVTITNEKNIEIDTGVTLETSAYVLIMALALAGFAMMAIRRREEY